MTWAKLDDRANEHRKILAAGAEACWLWSCGLMYANRQRERDGFIPEPMIAMLYPFKAPKKLAAKLVEVGLWEEAPGGYLIHEFTWWNQTKEQREAELEAGRQRAAKSYAAKQAKKSDSSPEEHPEEEVKTSGVFAASSVILPDPTPTPIPTPTPLPLPKDPSGLRAEPPPASAAAAAPIARGSKRVPVSWKENRAELGAIAVERGVSLDFELSKFRDHQFQRAIVDFDAAARNWMRNAKPERLNGISGPTQGSLVQMNRLQRIANMGDE